MVHLVRGAPRLSELTTGLECVPPTTPKAEYQGLRSGDRCPGRCGRERIGYHSFRSKSPLPVLARSPKIPPVADTGVGLQCADSNTKGACASEKR